MGGTCEFLLAIGLHLGLLALSPYLFTLIMDELISYILDEGSWCMLLADIILVDESRDGVKTKLEIWQEVFKFKGFKVRCTKLKVV